MDDELEYLPLSWLSQASYCLRRAALLLNERVWFENAETARGRAEHERVHIQRIERRGKNIKLYEYDVMSSHLSISGKCDCVEATYSNNGCKIPAADFPVVLYPIEYKHGSVRDEEEYKIQLCAEAMALEEMYQTHIPEGAIFFISSHKRMPVVLDDALRNETIKTAETLHAVRKNFSIPKAEYSSKCAKCSLREYCMPKAKTSAKQYCRDLKSEAEKVSDS